MYMCVCACERLSPFANSYTFLIELPSKDSFKWIFSTQKQSEKSSLALHQRSREGKLLDYYYE